MPRLRDFTRSGGKTCYCPMDISPTGLQETRDRLMLIYWGGDKMATILQSFSNSFFFVWQLLSIFQISPNSVPSGPIYRKQCWFKRWFGAIQATSYYLNQWRPGPLTHICVIPPRWVHICLSSTIFNHLIHWLYFMMFCIYRCMHLCILLCVCLSFSMCKRFEMQWWCTVLIHSD